MLKKYFPEFVVVITIIYTTNAFFLGFAMIEVILLLIYALCHIILQNTILADSVDAISDGYGNHHNLHNNSEYQKVVTDRLEICIRHFIGMKR
ncbi:hypothetical protein JTB14_012425 [Gonioctena quinquepunctata]|nr:hypothetical protein JTB14_012425 [Gonioctena quinquepunctata]